MAEEAQTRVANAVKRFVDDVDRGHIRKMEKNMHECAAQCLSNEVSSIEKVHYFELPFLRQQIGF